MSDRLSRQYLLACPADREAERARLRELKQRLTSLLDRRGFAFEARAIHSLEEAEGELLDGDFLRTCAGGFPIIWVNINFAEGAVTADELHALQDDFALEPYPPSG